MCEPAIYVLKSVFTRLVQQNAFASVATLRVVVFLRIHHRLSLGKEKKSLSYLQENAPNLSHLKKMPFAENSLKMHMG